VRNRKLRVALGQERLCERGCSVGITEGRDLWTVLLGWPQVA
jgi:hypothetical protein